MKKTITAIMILIFSLPAFSQDWQEIKLETNLSLTGISFLNADTGLVVSSGGRYLQTLDGGKNWSIFHITDTPLEDVFYLDSKTAYICGRKGLIVFTDDAGASWQNKSLKDTMIWFFDIEMFDENNGLVIGATRNPENPFEGIALRTIDGGKIWGKIETLGIGYNEISYRPGEPVYMMSFGKLNISNDMGKTWESFLTVEGEACRAISMYGKSGIITGPKGMCAFTRDSGKTWQITKQESTQLYIAAVMINENDAYIAGAEGVIKHTIDGGKSWTLEQVPDKFHVFDMAIGGNYLYAVGAKGGMIRKKIK